MTKTDLARVYEEFFEYGDCTEPEIKTAREEARKAYETYHNALEEYLNAIMQLAWYEGYMFAMTKHENDGGHHNAEGNNGATDTRSADSSKAS